MQTKNISGLFKHIEALHEDRPWGHVLDVGTGVKSLQWISTLSTESWTAVTASASMARNSERDYPGELREQDRILVGNWIDDKLLRGEQFDTLLLDYFIGAVDGFAPYWQDLVLERIKAHLKPGGRLYITALEPYVPLVAQDEVGQYIGDIGRLRDACLLLARQRPYREYPSDWVMRHLKRAGYTVISGQRFPIRYGERFINSQLGMCRQRVAHFADKQVAESMLKHIENMHRIGMQLLVKYNGLPSGHDYVIAATIE
ncbi:hypothetical protein CWE09_03700 [Aliidiomarina minuta]|uniref:Class I SAM-dependent methyltransferase n=1 Tax=Aliidiomarina minuta TaxID=880057 RepID=A0A432W6Z8_9GAMM|nr:class I SAM-dependent methyltransferase [Aliidiomarina minuta]RUO25845.1 hypothetical protein CWE09_03700 [Aliidiomarina minuta]